MKTKTRTWFDDVIDAWNSDTDDCVKWKGPTNNGGTPTVTVPKGRRAELAPLMSEGNPGSGVSVRRILAYWLGDEPAGMNARVTCKRQDCVNPRHVKLTRGGAGSSGPRGPRRVRTPEEEAKAMAKRLESAAARVLQRLALGDNPEEVYLEAADTYGDVMVDDHIHRDHYTYKHLDRNGTVIYVGKGQRGRAASHLDREGIARVSRSILIDWWNSADDALFRERFNFIFYKALGHSVYMNQRIPDGPSKGYVVPDEWMLEVTPGMQRWMAEYGVDLLHGQATRPFDDEV